MGAIVGINGNFGIITKGGQTYAFDLGLLSDEQMTQLRQLSPEDLQKKLEDMWNSLPEAEKLFFGYCKSERKGKHVSYVECLNCGLDTQKFKKLIEWKSCILLNLTK